MKKNLNSKKEINPSSRDFGSTLLKMKVPKGIGGGTICGHLLSTIPVSDLTLDVYIPKEVNNPSSRDFGKEKPNWYQTAGDTNIYSYELGS